MRTTYRILSLGIYLFISVVLFTCQDPDSSQEEGKVVLEGTLSQPGKGLVHLLQYTDNNFRKVDSYELNGDQFKFAIPLEQADFFALALPGRPEMYFVLSPDDPLVSVEIDNSATPLTYRFNNSEDSKHYQELEKIIGDFQANVQALSQQNPEAAPQELQAAYEKIQ